MPLTHQVLTLGACARLSEWRERNSRGAFWKELDFVASDMALEIIGKSLCLILGVYLCVGVSAKGLLSVSVNGPAIDSWAGVDRPDTDWDILTSILRRFPGDFTLVYLLSPYAATVAPATAGLAKAVGQLPAHFLAPGAFSAAQRAGALLYKGVMFWFVG